MATDGVGRLSPGHGVVDHGRWWRQQGGSQPIVEGRLWKMELQQLADETGLRIAVCHFPPATSKWNKIEHRLFAYITQNWRGRPLVSYEVIVNLIAHATTQTGLVIQAELDTSHYPTGRKVTDQELATLHLQPDTFHGEWNYVLTPRLPLNE